MAQLGQLSQFLDSQERIERIENGILPAVFSGLLAAPGQRYIQAAEPMAGKSHVFARLALLGTSWAQASWLELQAGGFLPGRAYHGGAWSSQADGFYVFGGWDGSHGGRLGDLRLYERQANRWQQLSPSGFAPAAREGHTAVWSPSDDGLYIFGGNGVSGQAYGLYLYKREANQWLQLSPGGSAPDRHLHAAAWSPAADGFYVFGGYGYNSLSGGLSRLNDLHLYDRQANRWQLLSPSGSPPSARTWHAAAWSPAADGLYVFGGQGFDATMTVGRLNDLYLYERQADRWLQVSPSGSPPSARDGHAMVWSPAADGLFIFGGDGGSGPLSDLHLYERQADRWLQLSPSGAPSGRWGHVASLSPRDALYVFGGYNGSTGGVLSDLYVYEYEALSRGTRGWKIEIGHVLVLGLFLVLAR
ncbi:Lztr1 [Symbiodinium natans]|uniref:Lztr1 protein n=1 Tax=Symbiodinium natans TaxID=878477 RepID=A0A812HRJ9_9DINO|nr:Lztr1 [Symbiodinium natans]